MDYTDKETLIHTLGSVYYNLCFIVCVMHTLGSAHYNLYFGVLVIHT